MALCMDWLYHCSMLHCPDGTYRINIPYLLSSCHPCQLRNMGSSVACFQQGSYGLYLVRCPIMDWRRMCRTYDICNLALLPKDSQRNPEFWDKYCVFCLVLHLLAMLTARNLVPSTPNPTLVHGKGIYSTHSRNCLFHLGHRSRSRYWTHCAPAC